MRALETIAINCEGLLKMNMYCSILNKVEFVDSIIGDKEMILSELLEFESNKIRLEELRKNRRNIVPFVGAGISKGCGLYTWGELLRKLADDYLSIDEINKLEKNVNFFAYADRIVDVTGNSDMIMRRIREIFSEAEIISSEIPYLLVSEFSQMVITTNYDTLLEEASIKSSVGSLKPILPCLTGQMNEAIQMNDRYLLKIHGSIEEISSFIFTTEQYRKFYGKKGDREGKLLPAYLMRIFANKKVLFVGCSLESDYTLEILEECIEQNRAISHFAIVPYPSDPEKQIKRKRELTRIGIEPIFYPEGKFQAVSQLISYLAEENHFITSLRKILLEIFAEDMESKNKLQILVSLLKESFYITALNFPQLLDIDNTKDDFTEDILEILGVSRKQSDTLLGICENAFLAYVKAGYLHCENEAVTFFVNQFEDKVLKEIEIEDMLKKQWSIDSNLARAKKSDLSWIAKLADKEINNYAIDLVIKLQYRNGMNFAEVAPIYENAKQFIELASEKIDYDIRIKLLNSLGAFGHYFRDGKAAVMYLERCINEIEKHGNTDRDTMLFKAKCYANLAIARSLSNASINSVLEAVEKDIFLKRKYNESARLYSRSLNFYATVLKEIDPFQACNIYMEMADVKEKIIGSEQDEGQVKELRASWATTIFNLGLLAKDIELYELAYKIICYANQYRFETVDYCNRDYCSSVNVRAELEMFVHKKQSLEWLIAGIESRVDLPIAFSYTMAHTWYVCAYYYYLKEDYSTAITYINKSIGTSKKEGALVDFRQDVRTKLLLGDIKVAQARMGEADLEEAETIYNNIIDSIISMYGRDSYYLIAPYRHLLQGVNRTVRRDEYSSYYKQLYDKYAPQVRELQTKIEKYMEGCAMTSQG